MSIGAMIAFACPSCGALLQFPDHTPGPSVHCPHCACSVLLPQRPSPKATPVPASGIDLAEAPSTLRADGIEGAGGQTAYLFPFLSPPLGPDEIGRLEHFRVLRLLGQGGMGVVFAAEDSSLHRAVALKVMRPDLARTESARLRFLREARAAAAIRHPHVVTIYHVGQDRHVPYLAMELLEGESLETRLRRERRLSVPEVLRIGREIAEGLAAAHERGLIHRDVKPGNVWLESTAPDSKVGRQDAARDADLTRTVPMAPAHAVALTAHPLTLTPPAPRVKLIDFGLAHVGDDDAHLTQSGAVLGTPAYMSPEQADGQPIDGRSDLFSLGCVLYRMATGDVPFPGTGTISTFRAMVKSRPTAPNVKVPDVPRELSRLILQLLNLDPARRPGSAGHVAAILKAMETRPPERRHRAARWIAGALVASAIVGGILFAHFAHRPSVTEPVVPLPEPEKKQAEAPSDEVSIVAISPPELEFFSKKAEYRKIAIKAHVDVADAALRAAHDRLRTMLSRSPRLIENLAASGAELQIIGRNQQVSDLPEHRHLKGKPFEGKLTVDERTRGLGGLHASCGEENLLHLPGDRYSGRDICVHEFAHTVRAYGLSADVRAQIEYQFRRSISKGLWKGSYAATNDDEFFAELSMWYFGTEGDTSKLSPKPARGRDGLRRYDPEAFALLDDIYSGKAAIGRNVYTDLPALPADREKSLHSISSSIHTTVLFINRSNRPVQIIWLDHQGERKLYTTLAPNNQYIQNTYATHPWLVVDGATVRGIYVPGPEPGRVVIEDEK